MKKLIVVIIVIAAVAVSAGVYYANRAKPEPEVATAQVTRGDIAEVVAATGTLEAVQTVNVGTQVSGVVQELHADYNDIVKQGQVIARLDPSIIQTQLEQQRANVTRAEADLDRLRVALADARQKLERAKELSSRNLIPKTELEAAELAVKTSESQIRSSEAGLVQARSQLNTQEVNLGHTVIKAPIDGIVIQRSVEQGQTVAASMNAPTLYILAADLTKMQVLANIDEADVGKMRPGLVVTFNVDAFPTDRFTGTVQQVRLQPTTVQNVVTYQTVISVPNPQYKLKPGMTANVTIEIARRNNVLRVPNAALRFRPTADIFAALNLPVPEDLNRGIGGRGAGGFGGRRGESGGQPATGAPATPGAQPGGQAGGAASSRPQTAPAPAQQPGGTQAPRAGSPESRGGGDPSAAGGERRGRGFDPNLTPEERQRRLQERLASMTPEQRAEFEARMRERGQGAGRSGAAGGQTARGGAPQGIRAGARTQAPSPVAPEQATTIDALFPIPPVIERRERVWLWVNKELKRVDVRTGISDGTWTELVDDGGLQQGTELVTNVRTGLEPQQRPGQQNPGASQNPLMGPQRGGPGRGR
jgi:HlyD family secretion protein